MPTEFTNIVSELTGIGRLLRDRALAVPAYQRNYSWSAEQVEAFWYDLRAALISDNSSHFLGTVVLSSGESNRGRLMVVDGQQRLATATMLLAAIRDEFADQGQLQLAKTVEETFLFRTSFHNGQREPRLLLNKNDVDFFHDFVLDRSLGSDAPDTPSHKLIAAAYGRLSALLTEDLQAAGPLRGERLRSWIDLVSDSASVIVLRVSADTDAFKIFETLNDRGLTMSINDLIKGYLVGLCRDDVDMAERLWDGVDREFDDYSTVSTTRFLRHWWAAHYGSVRERDLLRAIQRSVTTPKEALTLLEALSGSATAYAAALDPRHGWWSDYSERCRTSLGILLKFRQDQYRPLLLAAQEHFDPRELTKLLENLVSLCVRSSISRQAANVTERYYAEAAVSVSRGHRNRSANALRDLVPIFVQDDPFIEAFAARDGIRPSVARYLLTALRRLEEGEPETIIFNEEEEADYDVVGLITSKNSWQQPHSTMQSGAARLGNMFLIPANRIAHLPEELAPRLEAIRDLSPKSGLPPRSDLLGGPWLDERQRRMAHQAGLLWPQHGTAT